MYNGNFHYFATQYKPTMKHLLISLCLILLQFNVNAQNTFISGTIVDNENHQAVPYATITVKERQEGTLSNAEGKFSLLVKSSQKTDELIISCIGYESINIPISQFSDKDNALVHLKSKLFTLEEVTVTIQSISDLLEEAIATTQALIPQNQLYGAYYKEFAYLDKKLYKFSDAAIAYAVNNEGRKTKTDLYILESRIKQDSVSDEEKWRSDVESLIDPQKAIKDYYNLNYLNTFISKKNNKKFDFSSEQNGRVIKININPKADVKQYLPNGIVYINIETKRIIRVDYDYITHLQYMPKVNLIVLAMSYERNRATILYDEGEKAFLRYCNINQDVRFKVGKKQGLLGSKAEIVFHELQEQIPEITDKSYSKINIYRSGNNFTTDFWKNYNSLTLTESELDILR